MKTANELYKISQKCMPEIVNKVIDGVREHIAKRCEEEAAKGATYYNFYVRKAPMYCAKLLFDECLKIANDFEPLGYKVSIYDGKSPYEDLFCEYIIIFSWNGLVKKSKYPASKLYDTDNGIIIKKINNEPNKQDNILQFWV